jgi:bifunctional polynucleotide phosphatase/kinase
MEIKYCDDGLLVYGKYPVNDYYAFDLDHTLIKPKSSRTHPVDFDDWKYMYKIDEIINKINGREIVIFTNQMRLKTQLLREGFIQKVTNCIGRDFLLVCAYGGQYYRKPSPNMYKFVCNNTAAKAIVYVGDAAGRTEDFSDSDRKFAHNIGVDFKTPEEFFLGITQELPLLTYLDTLDSPVELNFNDVNNVNNNGAIILMVGLPGAGKSTYSKIINGIIVNQDTVKDGSPGTLAQCLRKVRQSISDNHKGANIIIDNTNLTRAIRKKYIDIAREHEMKIFAVWFDIDVKTCKHMNFLRAIGGGRHVPEITYRTMLKKYEKVERTEGFDEIITIDKIFMKEKCNLLS